MFNKYELSSWAIEKARKPILAKHIRRLTQALTDAISVSENEPQNVVNLYSFDWSPNNYSRNWWWNIQQLPSLSWASGDLKSIAKDQVRVFIKLNMNVIQSWVNSCRDHDSLSPLAWHDHASALRAIHLFRWFNSILAADVEYPDLGLLEELIVEHTLWLVDEKNYSKANNHGFEQAWILLEITTGWPGHDRIARYSQLAIDRLTWEIRRGFTDEGIHIENSPGYQFFMIKRLRELQKFLDEGGLALSGLDLNMLIHQADEFLVAIALPDSTLPLIGDTLPKDNQNRYISRLRRSLTPGGDQCIFDYSKSGYFIWQSNGDSRTPSIHFIFKNSHESSYHRHDDDLMVHLSLNGRVIFGDSGLYTHDKSSRIRQHVRSPHAHSTVFPADGPLPERRPSALRKKPRAIYRPKKHSVSGTTFAYKGFVISRRCKLIGSNGRILRVQETVKNRTHLRQEMITGFLLPDDLACEIDMEKSRINISYNAELTLDLIIDEGEVRDIRIVHGWHDDSKHSAIMSRKIGEYVLAKRILIIWTAEANSQSGLNLLLQSV